MQNRLQKNKDKCIELIRGIDFNQLDISPYNQAYIQRMILSLEYYFSIYIQCVSLLPKHKPEEKTIIDFGGGHGFLSLFLKSLGYSVIYCDLNPLSVDTIKQIKQILNFGPDYILHGSSLELKQFCEENQLEPSFLIATDLIEHVYNLELFFAELRSINPLSELIFTTGSNPANTCKARKLRKMMVEEEKTYLQQRDNFIDTNFPDITPKDKANLAFLCRGKTYEDMENSIMLFQNEGILPVALSDPYNTCDPINGNWTERILPFDEYNRLAKNNNLRMTVHRGFYNQFRENTLLSKIVLFINTLIKKNKSIGIKLAPYIALKFSLKHD